MDRDVVDPQTPQGFAAGRESEANDNAGVTSTGVDKIQRSDAAEKCAETIGGTASG